MAILLFNDAMALIHSIFLTFSRSIYLYARANRNHFKIGKDELKIVNSSVTHWRTLLYNENKTKQQQKFAFIFSQMRFIMMIVLFHRRPPLCRFCSKPFNLLFRYTSAINWNLCIYKSKCAFVSIDQCYLCAESARYRVSELICHEDDCLLYLFCVLFFIIYLFFYFYFWTLSIVTLCIFKL